MHRAVDILSPSPVEKHQHQILSLQFLQLLEVALLMLVLESLSCSLYFTSARPTYL